MGDPGLVGHRRPRCLDAIADFVRRLRRDRPRLSLAFDGWELSDPELVFSVRAANVGASRIGQVELFGYIEGGTLMYDRAVQIRRACSHLGMPIRLAQWTSQSQDQEIRRYCSGTRVSATL